MEKWYVIQVRTGQEEKIKAACALLISPLLLKECFIPKFKRVKKMRGFWDEIEEILFPGYVFMITEDAHELYRQLKKVPDLTKMISKYGQEVFPLDDDEVVFLKSFGKEEHIVEMSKGYIENDRISVTRGPMQGKEGLITKVDRHKRIAFIDVEFFGKKTTVKVGLEIIKKIKSEE